jgi:hypothetical protein
MTTLCLMLGLNSASLAQVHLDGVPQVLPTRTEDCTEHARQWHARIQTLEAARNTCERRDGGTVRTAGVWLPNCGARQQAYITCAPISDQVCTVRKQMDASVQACHQALAAQHQARRDHETAAARLEQQLDNVRRTVQQFHQAQEAAAELHDKGIAATVIDRLTATPAAAGEQLQSHLRDAARTAGTRAPDASPELSRIGRVLDELNARASMNEVARAFSGQSQAAARARMSDALNQFEGIAGQAMAEGVRTQAQGQMPAAMVPSPTRRVPTSVREPEPIEEDEIDDQELQEERGSQRNQAVMTQTLRGLHQIQQQLLQLQQRQRAAEKPR